jgi:hypothetical protein
VKPHTGKKNQTRLNDYCRAKGWRITFRLQSANSPECNLLDLTVWSALQAQAQKLKRNFELKTLDQFQAFIIEDVWAKYNPEFIKNGFGYLFEVYNRILSSKGDNIHIEGHHVGEMGVKQKLKTGVPLYTCFYKTEAEYSARLQEIYAFFQEWAPPPKAARPILPHGMIFGTKKRLAIEVDADSDSD